MASIDKVNDITPRRQYVALAGQTAFDYPFPIFNDSDVVVDVDGVTKALNVDYTVSGAGNDTGGTVTFASPLAGGEVVTLYRDIAITRDTDFQQNGPFRADALNDELDKAFLIMQELESKIGRALRLPITAEATDAQAELSPIDNWKGRYVTINSSGVPEPAALSGETMTQSTIGALLYPQTAAETSAGVTPTNYAYPPLNILRYGALGDGTTVNTTAIQAALDVAAISGGEVVIPPGVFLTRQLTIPSNVTVSGFGRRSLLKRDPSWVGTNNNILYVATPGAASENITIKRFAVDLNGADSFGRIIQLGLQDVSGTLYTSRNIRIERMIFMDSNPNLAAAGDKWAIVFRSNLRDVWIEHCISSGDMQLTAGGTDEYRNVNILFNIVTEGDRNGIAISVGRTDAVVDGLKVIGNYVEATSLCYFFGPDHIYSADTGMRWKNVTFSHNTARTRADGKSSASWMGCYFNAPPEAMAGVSGTGNIVECLDPVGGQIGYRFDDANGYGGGAITTKATFVGGNVRGCRHGVDIVSGGHLAFTGLGIDDCVDGIYVRNAIKVNITGGYIRGGTRAINVANGEVLITGVDAAGGAGQTGSFAGRLTLSPGDGQTAKVMAVGNKFTDGSTGTNIYGVRGAATGTGVTELQLINNDLRGNDAAVSNITPDLAVGNLGYVTENGGTSPAISSGGTIAHGLAGTPTFFSVTPTAAATDVYVTADSTNLTVTFGGGGSVAFAWKAQLANTFP